VAIGGSGGSGGDAGTAQSTVTGGSIATGQNPLLVNGGTGGAPCTTLPCNLLPVDDYGVVIQSVGGGGGLGGSALAQSVAVPVTPSGNQVAIALSAAVGGTGGTGGNGETAQFALSTSGVKTAGTITTSGQGSTAVLVQSVGGGGGNAGFGSGNTQRFGTGDYAASVNVTLGATGGAGGNGGAVWVYLFPGNGITTYGSGAIGVLGQSIGGGGASQGGSYSFGVGAGTSNVYLYPKATIDVGVTGDSGGTGGNVTVSAQAPITTHGGDATGILAQSIGGGGGLGGSAGADASADNPVVAALATREGESLIESYLKGWYRARGWWGGRAPNQDSYQRPDTDRSARN
jgi:hypothetical protein